jgi:hypothetical protein
MVTKGFKSCDVKEIKKGGEFLPYLGSPIFGNSRFRANPPHAGCLRYPFEK